MYEDTNVCPNCGEDWNGFDCYVCGFDDMGTDTFETPQGNIVRCTEQDAMDRGYITRCNCGEIITWWEARDHGMCITCWHKRNIDNKSK